MGAKGDGPMRTPGTFIAAGAAVAALSIALAAAAGPPYASLEHLSPWLVTFAIGLFVAMFATPFAIHASLGGELEADTRWERALLWWGAVAVGLLAVGLLVGLPSGFASGSLAGSIGLVAVIESAMVLATLVAWLLSN